MVVMVRSNWISWCEVVGIAGFADFQSSSHQNSFGSVKLNFESPGDYSVSGK